MIVRAFKTIGSLLLLATLLVARPTPVLAGTVILEGSDAIGLHCGLGNVFACQYRDQTWSAIGGADPRPIAVIGNGNAGSTGSGTHAVQGYASVAAAIAGSGTGNLNGYVALYFTANSGCCDENDSLITAAGAQSAVAAYLGGGGTVMINDYIGGAAWDFAVGTVGGGNAHVGGFLGGQPGPTCDDGETVTALGLANGFTQPGPMGCWTHQGYDMSFFGPLGFTLSFFNSPAGYAAANPPPEGPWSSLLSNGRTVTGSATPEPATLVLFGTGAVAAAMRRRRQRK